MSPSQIHLPQPDAVVFDLDGTLVDTVKARIEAWMRVFAEEGIAADRHAVAALIGSDGRRMARVTAEAAGISLEDGRDEAIDRRSGELYDELNTDPQALPGAHRLLEALDGTSIGWAIATSSRREQTTASVAALALDVPPRIVDGSHVEHAKPAPDLLLRAAEELTVAPARTWYVGDATWDMLAAVAAGMPAIGVTTGAVGTAELESSGASLVVASLDELLAHMADAGLLRGD
jgi:HAD superfamily hydrolase (TIGR01509 family)